MGQPAARMNDQVAAVDIHIVMIPAPPGPPIPTPLPHPFSGPIQGGVWNDVLIEGMPAATVDSVAFSVPPHIPQGGPFQIPPTSQGKVIMGSMTVQIHGKGAARVGDPVDTCKDIPGPSGAIVPPGAPRVLIG